MAKPLRNLLIFVLIAAVLGAGAWWLLRTPETLPQADNGQYLMQKEMADVAQVSVQNENGSYTVTQSSDTVTVADLPPQLVNLEYVAMLLDECSSVAYTDVAANAPDTLSLYGLDAPVSTVDITYADGTTLRLLLGAEEPVSGGRYFKTDRSDTVYVMPVNRTIRFTMPVEKYINYVILAPNESTSILSVVQDITFSGTALPQPIVLKAVLEDRAEIRREAASFGAVTHLITAPYLHEADQTELIRLTDSLLGLISEGVVAYNCTPEQLAAYGFDAPVLQVEFDEKNGTDAAVEHHVLKLALLDGTYIATLDDWGVVYRIAAVDFTTVNYEALVLRWFLSPFLTDVKQIEVTFGETAYTFDVTGDTAKEIVAACNGAPVDSDLFRKYYNLVVSAASEGAVEAGMQPQGQPLVSVRFVYRDSAKPDDVMELYEGDTRRVLVAVNGVCEFTMREKYVSCLKAATENMANGQIFSTEW